MLRKRLNADERAATLAPSKLAHMTGETALIPQLAATIAAHACFATDSGQRSPVDRQIIMAVTFCDPAHGGVGKFHTATAAGQSRLAGVPHPKTQGTLA